MARTAQPETTAVVVTCGATPYLKRTLHGLAQQTHAPTRVVIVNIWRSGRDVGTGDDIQSIVTGLGLDQRCRVRVLAAPDSTNFGDAVRRGLELNTAAQQRADKLHETRTGEIPVIRSDTSPGWLWLLHDDSAPDPEALERLLKTGESGPSIAVVGSKQRGWENEAQLLEVGIHATASARRFDPMDDDEIDQGQYDHLDDVLAVGLAGALVRRDVWSTTGGPDPALGPFGDGLEFSRRVRIAGYRVVVEPTAIIYHARASYLGLRTFGHGRSESPHPDVARSYGARRKAQLYNWVVATPAWKLPLLLLYLVVLTPARALARFVGKDMQRARAELSAGAAVLSRPDLWLAARRRTRAGARISPAQLAILATDSAEIRAARRERRRSEAEVRRTKSMPSELEMREMAELMARRRYVGAAVGFGALALAAIAFYRVFNAAALTGGGVLPDAARFGSLWQTALSAWIPQGAGHAGPADPLFTVLALPLVFGMSLSAVVKWTMLLAVPLIALSAWFAAGVATRSTALRAFAAAVWAAGPLTLTAVGEGRLGAVIALIAAPAALALTARALGLYRRDHVLSGLVGARRAHPLDDDDDEAVILEPVPPPALPIEPRRPSLGAAALASLAFAVVAAGSPALLVVGTALLLILTVVSRHRATVWFIPIPALVLYGPWLQSVITENNWRALLAAPGVPIESNPVEPWQNLLGLPSAVGLEWPLNELLLVPGAALLVAALAALLRGTGRARAVRVGWAIAVLGLALAIVAPQVTVAHTADGLAAQGWGGHGVTLMTLGLLMAALSGADGVQGVLANHSFGVRHIATAALTVVVALCAASAPVVWSLAFGHHSQVHEARAAMTPALSRQLADAPTEARTLALIPTEDGLRAEVWRGDGPQLSETSMLVAARAVRQGSADVADELLSQVAAAAAVGGQDGVAEELASFAIGVVLVPHETDASLRAARDELIAALSTVPSVVLVTENDSGAVFRVISDDTDSPAADVARVQLLNDGQLLSSHGMNSELEPLQGSATLRLAERANPNWVATLDGVRLARHAGEWAQEYAMPAGDGGSLEISYAPPFHSWWHWAQAIVFTLAVILALPVRRRKEVG
ncbi:Glycosyltransferase, GT2 family [Ruaniaceae bacterium KH17]|nr:Glycosyltransferase, GT2 family [Ruaniaceae bacterium KH17]